MINTTVQTRKPFPVPQSIAHLIANVEDKSNPYMQRVRVSFTNGYALSIISGEDSYGSHAGLLEIAPWNTDGALDGSLFDEEDQGDDVLGYCTPEKITYYMKKLANL